MTGVLPAPAPAVRPLPTEVLRGDDALEPLRGPWRDLHARCAAPTPFQSHAWLASWWRAYGTPGSLRVVLVREGHRLVAAGAFVLERRLGVRVLLPVGAGISDLGDVLVDPARADAALPALAAALRAEPGWDVLDLPEVRPGAAVDGLVERWPGPRWAFPASICLVLPAAPLEELLARLPSKTAATIRKKLRRADGLGLGSHPVPPGGVPAAVDELLALHERQWAGRGGNPEHLRPRFRAHLVGALTPMVADGEAIVLRTERDGVAVACDVLLLAGGVAGDYLGGVDPALRTGIDTYTVLLRAALDAAVAAGAREFDQLRGREPHKERLRPTPVRSRRLVLAAGRRPAASGYAALLAARSRAVGLLRERPELRARVDRVRTAVDTARSRAVRGRS